MGNPAKPGICMGSKMLLAKLCILASCWALSLGCKRGATQVNVLADSVDVNIANRRRQMQGPRRMVVLPKLPGLPRNPILLRRMLMRRMLIRKLQAKRRLFYFWLRMIRGRGRWIPRNPIDYTDDPVVNNVRAGMEKWEAWVEEKLGGDNSSEY